MRQTVGEALVTLLEAQGVDLVFGIPGVHTVELYRGLDASNIRHVTPRHEQGAGFMADGYARVTGRPGVCFLITGPGLTNAITAMGQARADSIPMLVVSSVNPANTIGRALGQLHELPQQTELSETVAVATYRLEEPEQLVGFIEDAFKKMVIERPGPIHIEIPTDVLGMTFDLTSANPVKCIKREPSTADLEAVVRHLEESEKVLVIAGGGCAFEGEAVRRLAEKLDAPTVTTINARGVMKGHRLEVPASPAMISVRKLISEADCVLALGTEIADTDYDMFGTGPFPDIDRIIRVDIDPAQFEKRDDEGLMIHADVGLFVESIIDRLAPKFGNGDKWAEDGRKFAKQELSETYLNHIDLVHTLWKAFPNARIVGDSTQLIYAANMYVEAPASRLWFNSATGFGTLGYSVSAAIGAALAEPTRDTFCLVGDGGLQFTLSELGTAFDTNVNVAYLVWNNNGYGEILSAMERADVAPVGVSPSAPDFVKIAEAYGLSTKRVQDRESLIEALKELPRPCLIDMTVPEDGCI